MFICLKFLTPPVSILSNIKTLDRNRQTETINDHFTNVAQVLAQDIPVVDANPESYLEPTDHSFSLQIPSVDIVSNVLSKIDEKKATGLDMIPSTLLKMAANMVAPSLTSIFPKSILTGIYPNHWKMAKVPSGLLIGDTKSNNSNLAILRSTDLPILRSSDLAIHQSSDPAIQQSSHLAIHPSSDPPIHRSSNPAIQRSSDPAIQRSSDPAIQRSSEPAIQRSSDLAI